MNAPLIDVLIVVYNGEKFIADAVASIQAQTWKNLRIVIVDDGSEDGTARIVSEMMQADGRIKLVRQRNAGISAALNTAIRSSDSPYVAFLDADDLWHTRKLEKQMKCLAGNNADICFCLIKEFETFEAGEAPSHSARPEPMKGYSKTGFLGKRLVFDEYGLFDETIKIGDFIEWFGRVVRAKNNVAMVDEVLSYRRIHHANTTGANIKGQYLELLKAHLDKKRQANKG